MKKHPHLRHTAQKQNRSCTKGEISKRISSRVTQETKRKQSNAFQILRENDLLPRILHPDKLPIKTEDKIKTFPDIQFCQTFISSTFFLRKLLKGVFHQNEGVNQEKGSHGIPEPGAPREKEGEGKW